jgi:hypothetical protein
MNTDLLSAHSVAETFLYLMAKPCPGCGAGPLRGGDAHPTDRGDTTELAVPYRCERCGYDDTLRFTVPGGLDAVRARQGGRLAARINSTDEPSRIIDLAEWLVIFRMVAEAAATERDRGQARRLGYEAAQCLEEAMKFYEGDNDLPPDNAFFSEASRRRRRDHPEEFSRERLIGLRGRLPTLDAMEASEFVSRKPRRKRWWMPW